MAARPSWCPNPTCTPMTSLGSISDEKAGSCIGKLAQPADHGSLKGINDKQWCVLSGRLAQIQLNNEDMEFFIYQMASAAKTDGKPLTFWMAKTLEENK